MFTAIVENVSFKIVFPMDVSKASITAPLKAKFETVTKQGVHLSPTFELKNLQHDQQSTCIDFLHQTTWKILCDLSKVVINGLCKNFRNWMKDRFLEDALVKKLNEKLSGKTVAQVIKSRGL